MVHSHLHVSRRQTFFFKEPIRKGNTKRGEWLDRIRFSGEHKTFFRRIPIFRLVSYPRILLVMAYQSSMIKYKFPCLNNIRSENFLPNWCLPQHLWPSGGSVSSDLLWFSPSLTTGRVKQDTSWWKKANTNIQVINAIVSLLTGQHSNTRLDFHFSNWSVVANWFIII